MDPIELRTEVVNLIQTLQAEVENDCVGIQAAKPASDMPGQTPESQKSWADKLAEMQARAAGLKDLMEFVQACPVDPTAAANELSKLQASLDEQNAAVTHALDTVAALTKENEGLNQAQAAGELQVADLENKLKAAQDALTAANAAHA